jgi:hypothetical protein
VIIVRLERLLAGAAVVAGSAAWMVFSRAGVVLSHYDARAHLVVARRLIDNITPGWQQIGGVWLPLPHLLYALPTQIDVLYRTGAFASLVSIGCLGLAAYAAARLTILATGSHLGAGVSAALLTLNPNLLYLHTTPMTEPLLLATTFVAVLWLTEWVPQNQDRVPSRLGWALFAASWTRYEAWLVIGAAVPAALYASSRIGASRASVARRAWRLAAWPGAAVASFLVISRITTGAWFVAAGFFEPDPIYEHHFAKSALAVWWGTHQLSTRTTELVALAGALTLAMRGTLRRAEAPLLILVALLACTALPLYAFYAGHPFRIRYMIPAVAASALFSGIAVGFLHRQAPFILAGLLVGISLVQSPPWWSQAPMLVEAQWDRRASEGRRQVTSCLAASYRGEKILASMGSLAHYMQELSQAGFDIKDFVHEGTGVIWGLAMETGPQPHAGWMLVEEQAEGGDVLARRIRRDPGFARGMTRMCDGGGVTLYRRQ